MVSLHPSSSSSSSPLSASASSSSESTSAAGFARADAAPFSSRRSIWNLMRRSAGLSLSMMTRSSTSRAMTGWSRTERPVDLSSR
jgi:hypothetical protein